MYNFLISLDAVIGIVGFVIAWKLHPKLFPMFFSALDKVTMSSIDVILKFWGTRIVYAIVGFVIVMGSLMALEDKVGLLVKPSQKDSNTQSSVATTVTNTPIEATPTPEGYCCYVVG